MKNITINKHEKTAKQLIPISLNQKIKNTNTFAKDL